MKKLKRYDVVLTTYSTLVLDFPDDEGALKKAKAKARKDGGDEADYFEVHKTPFSSAERYSTRSLRECTSLRSSKKKDLSSRWVGTVSFSTKLVSFRFSSASPLLADELDDVAENIRNRQTKMSRAVAGLDALMRWSLTGTPITKYVSLSL